MGVFSIPGRKLFSLYGLTSLLSLTFCALLFPACIFAQKATVSDTPLSNRRVRYEIEVTLHPESRTLTGSQRLYWRNPDKAPVDELQFHLYLNAFRDENSTFMREGGGYHRGFSTSGQDRMGRIDVVRMMLVEDGQSVTNLTDGLRFIQPDDHNPNDRTVASVKLPEPVPPGETIRLDIDFEAKLPRVFARTGWAENPDGSFFFMVGQWFPKIGVLEVPGQRYVPADAPRGVWNTHQFHANSEFYADFGVYEVSITLPKEYLVGATGVRISESENDSTRTVVYRAEDVHDFAWTASPTFLELTEQWRHVQIRLLIQPEHRRQADRHFEAAKIALEKLDEWVGPYPYTTLTLVDGRDGSNGMEYPTLITCGTAYALPPWFRVTEMTTIHELVHQYFYGLIASNEFEEAWLDEGFTSYLEARIMDTAYGTGSVLAFPGLRTSNGAFQRTQYSESNPSRGALFGRSWEYGSTSEYARASYSKPVVVLTSLEHLLGWNTMQEILKTYYSTWRFRHPTTRDFFQITEEVSGLDLDWFFDQFVYGTAVVDYAVEEIRNDPETGSSRIVIRRLADGHFPQEIRVSFADGTSDLVSWDGKDSSHTLFFNREVSEVYVDPDNRVWLDVNRFNNRKAAEPGDLFARKMQLKATVWLQQLFYLLAGLF